MDDSSGDLPCAQKLIFNSRRDAQAAAITLDHQRGLKLRPYRCRYCRLWHLASKF